MWWNGIYYQRASMVAIENCMNGKKAKLRYFDEPIMSAMDINTSLTQEQIDERELKKMLLNEDMWIRQSKRKGLPETVII